MIRSSSQEMDGKPFTGRHMLLLVVGFFGVVVAVNVMMAFAASTTWTGLVVPNSYVASQEFQSKADAARAQRDLGWHATLSLGGGRIVLSVLDLKGTPAVLGDVLVQVSRPVGGRDDQVLDLERGGDGSYAAPLLLAKGVWDVRVIAPKTSAGPFELHERVRIGEDAQP
jgi:nitrogen fixation protein FixH